MHNVPVLVPSPHSPYIGKIAPRSAIVGRRGGVGLWVVDYEGNVYGASNLTRFRDRLSVAVGRSVMRAPTTARGIASDWMFEVVGFARVNDSGRLLDVKVDPDRRHRLKAWLEPSIANPHVDLDAELG